MLYRCAMPIVLALPRGGVPVGYEIAVSLNAPLDVLTVRKIGAPGDPELGIGAVASHGTLIVDEPAVHALGIDGPTLFRLIKAEYRELARRERVYRGDAPFPNLRSRTVIIADDGLATGVSARAAIDAVRQRGAGRIILAVPVGARETIRTIPIDVDDVICLSCPSNLGAVGYWYRDFEQVTDESVIALLKAAESWG